MNLSEENYYSIYKSEENHQNGNVADNLPEENYYSVYRSQENNQDNNENTVNINNEDNYYSDYWSKENYHDIANESADKPNPEQYTEIVQVISPLKTNKLRMSQKQG